MANASTAARLFRRLRARQVSTPPDFADFGTAFGLEMSLQPDPGEPDGSVTAHTRVGSWWRRRATRRKTPPG